MLKDPLRKLFSIILTPLESGNGPYDYRPSHRTILIVLSVLFSGLAIAIVVLAEGQDPGYLFPALVFAAVGLTGFVVGLLGEDRAVAKIWGTGKR